MCHGLFSFLIAQIVFRISKDKKGALTCFQVQSAFALCHVVYTEIFGCQSLN